MPTPTFHEQIEAAEMLAAFGDPPKGIAKLANIARDLANLVGDLNRELREERSRRTP